MKTMDEHFVSDLHNKTKQIVEGGLEKIAKYKTFLEEPSSNAPSSEMQSVVLEDDMDLNQQK